MSNDKQLDPTSLVARIIAELQANPDAQRLLLRALLTNEFLGMPARLDRIEKDIAELKADVTVLKADVTVLKTDVAYLKGSDLENRLHKKIRGMVGSAFALRRPHIVQSPVLEPAEDFLDRLEDALGAGLITDEQDARIEATDFILRARRREDGAAVWVAVEVSNTVHAKDIQRARAAADALRTVFDMEALAVAAGYKIDARDAERAKASGVQYLAATLPTQAEVA